MATPRTRRPRTPVPPVEPTDDVAPLVEDAPAPAPTHEPDHEPVAEPADEPTQADTAAVIAAIAGAGLTTEAAAVALTAAGAVLGLAVTPVVDVAPEPPTKFVRARHAELGAEAVLARTALADWPGWEAFEDVPDSEPSLSPVHTQD